MRKCICISIEGSDGAGKATTTALLVQHLINSGKKVANISFPRYEDTTGGKILKEVLKSERKENYNFISLPPEIASLAYIMDRAESRNEIEKMIKENDYLIFDRYVSSNFIHQGGKINNDKERENLISFLSELEYDKYNLPKPNITFFLYLPVSIAIKNKEKQRINDQNVKMDAGEDDVDYLENSNKSGLWCIEKYGWIKINCINERGLQKTKKEILNEILEIL